MTPEHETTASRPQAEAEAGSTLVLRLRASDPIPAGAHADAPQYVLLGPEADGGKGFEPGALGRSHGLIEGIGEAIGAAAIRRLVIPALDGAEDPDERAAIMAAASAASVMEVDVQVGDAALRPSLEVFNELREACRARHSADSRTATAVISAWNKKGDVCANLLGIRAQTRPFDDIVVVDNHSSDGTPEMIRRDFPDVRLVVMPNSDYGACETFNVGFSTALTEYIAILDDDVVLTPWWLERSLERMGQEPETTAVVSTKVVEPGMPDSYRDSESVNRERYMSTFRGCASLARKEAIDKAGGYDERLFLYGNERDLTCRLLNLGYRVLQFPGAETFHRTPFGVQMGKRSLYFHARNAWLGMLKYAPLTELVKMPFLVVTKVLFRGGKKEEAGEVTDAVGTIGIGKAVRQTKGSWWILTKATASIIYNIPYCLKRRQPVKAPDFELPLK